MNTKPTIQVAALLVFALAFGCSDKQPPPSKALERATSNDSMLTSTSSAASPPEAADSPTKKQDAPPVDLVDEAQTEPSFGDVKATSDFVPELQPTEGLSIQRLVTAPAVEHREPVAASSIFAAHEEKIYAFVDVRNESDEVETLVVYFIGPNGFASGGIALDVPPRVPRWRTWAFTKHAKEPGLWRVEVRNVKGDLVGALPFEVDHGC